MGSFLVSDIVALLECPPKFKLQGSQARFLGLRSYVAPSTNGSCRVVPRRLFRDIAARDQQNQAARGVNAADDGDAETAADLSKTGFEARSEETLRHLKKGP